MHRKLNRTKNRSRILALTSYCRSPRKDVPSTQSSLSLSPPRPLPLPPCAPLPSSRQPAPCRSLGHSLLTWLSRPPPPPPHTTVDAKTSAVTSSLPSNDFASPSSHNPRFRYRRFSHTHRVPPHRQRIVDHRSPHANAVNNHRRPDGFSPNTATDAPQTTANDGSHPSTTVARHHGRRSPAPPPIFLSSSFSAA
ncbi:hypothetical protein Nepgr_008295 [Nepenthes gracilis]|uniref:Uncharacterized protein n=1 Tax=Nepenthes gracilis TaxID=150966 RepID=A0AAD3S8H0_NEPGR|nr:hypothetical protein Nepgr_008295 [Nepenthes gracilis]